MFRRGDGSYAVVTLEVRGMIHSTEIGNGKSRTCELKILS